VAGIPAVLLTGGPDAGKSVVAREVHELLRLAGVRNAMIDLDAVGRVHPAADEPFNAHLVVANLEAMWPNFLALDLDYLVLARVVLSAEELNASARRCLRSTFRSRASMHPTGSWRIE
jgi:hypothetical protein